MLSTPETQPKWILAPRFCIENTSQRVRVTRTVWEPSSPRVEILIGPFVMIRFISNLKKWSLQRQSGDASRGGRGSLKLQRCYEIPVEIVGQV